MIILLYCLFHFTVIASSKVNGEAKKKNPTNSEAAKLIVYFKEPSKPVICIGFVIAKHVIATTHYCSITFFFYQDPNNKHSKIDAFCQGKKLNVEKHEDKDESLSFMTVGLLITSYFIVTLI